MGHDSDLSKANSSSTTGITPRTPGTPGTLGTPGTQGTLAPSRLPGYVVRTDVAKRGTRAFINVCGSGAIGRPFYRDGRVWTVPHGISANREEAGTGKRADKCQLFDFVVHPSTLELIGASDSFRKAVNNLAVDSIAKQFSVRLDRKNLTFPDMAYKGTMTNAPCVEKLAQISVEECGNELNEFYTNEAYKEINGTDSGIDRNCNVGLEGDEGVGIKIEEICQGENEKRITNGNVSNVELIDFEDRAFKEASSLKKISENCIDISSINSMNAIETAKSQICIKDDDASFGVLPNYESLQEEASVTFIFDARKVQRENVSLNVKSGQEISLKMVAFDEDGSPQHYQCCLKFGNKCRFVDNGCCIDVSETNVVLTITKTEKSHGKWHSYFIGTSFMHLDVRDFTTVDNLKRALDALDMSDGCRPGDENLTKNLKAEEKESEDIPSEIIVVHERRIPRLHGILKPRSMSESSDDLSAWSYSAERLMSTTTASSDTESEDYEREGSPVRFRPCFKKSVSFSEHIDETLFIINQSVSQMHQALKNKRRRMRKREQKHEQKEARRRFRSSSESCSTQSDRDFIGGFLPAEKQRLAFMYGEKVAWDSAVGGLDGKAKNGEYQDGGNDSTLLAGEDYGDEELAMNQTEEDNQDVTVGDCKSGGTPEQNAEKVCGNLAGTSSGSGLKLIAGTTSLETCGRTSGGGMGNVSGSEHTVDVIGGNMGALSYTSGARTSGFAAATASPGDDIVLGCKWTPLENEIGKSSDGNDTVGPSRSAFKASDDDDDNYDDDDDELVCFNGKSFVQNDDIAILDSNSLP